MDINEASIHDTSRVSSSASANPPVSSTAINTNFAENEDLFAFTAVWDNRDTSNLLPVHLHRPAVQHAWERKPYSPFTRRKVKVGKVWKRPNNQPRSTVSEASAKLDLSSARAVKKICFETGFGVSARVMNWEPKGSPPRRRIVTRSRTADETSEEMFLALPDFDDDHDDDRLDTENSVIAAHVIRGDGSIEEVDPCTIDGNREWLDIEEDQDFDDTSTPLRDDSDPQSNPDVEYTISEGHETGLSRQNEPSLDLETPSISGVCGPCGIEAFIHKANKEPETSRPVEGNSRQLSPVSHPPIAEQKENQARYSNFTLPTGFVSPAAERIRRSKRYSGPLDASRRRTLPSNFPPSTPKPLSTNRPRTAIVEEPVDLPVCDFTYSNPVSQPGLHHDADSELPTPTSTTRFSPDVANASGECNRPNHEVPENQTIDKVSTEFIHGAHGDLEPEGCPSNEVTTDAAPDDSEWEDVEESPASPHNPQTVEVLRASINGNIVEDIGEILATAPAAAAYRIPFGSAVLKSPAQFLEAPVRDQPWTERTTFSPKTYASQHSVAYGRLQRSRRRQSTSPMKPASGLQPAERHHLIAFTPIKTLASAPEEYKQTSPRQSTVRSPPSKAPGEDSNVGSLRQSRYSSTPPEDITSSQQKLRPARISDDTALLQAFLSRAAESKTSSQLCTALESDPGLNCAESNTHQAPTPSDGKMAPEILADLDPNSPLPRKVSDTDDAAKTAGSRSQAPQSEDITLDSPIEKSVSRRSNRAKKRSEGMPGMTSAGPNKISIRGNADAVVLRRTEAQELALLTRNNTRKNQGGAVLPSKRLAKIEDENSSSLEEAQIADVLDVEAPRRKSVRWANMLLAYHGCSAEPEVSLLNEALDTSQLGVEPREEDGTDASITTQAPRVTTSKPRLQRVKTPRGDPGSISTPSSQESVYRAAETDGSSATATTKSKIQKSKSRIATPARPKTNSVLLSPADEQGGEVIVGDATLPISKKNPVSKLPAPSSISSTAPASSLASVGKENSLITSPPKKRAKQRSSTILAGRSCSYASNAVPSTLDASRSMGSLALRRQTDDQDMVPGIASPAKKRQGQISSGFGDDVDMVKPREKEELRGPGMGSPAKRRLRRDLQ